MTVKEFPEVGVTSASQKVILLKGRSVSMTNLNDVKAEATGRLNVAPKAPLQPLLPERRDLQFPLVPVKGIKISVVPVKGIKISFVSTLPPIVVAAVGFVRAGEGVVAGSGP